MATNQDAASTWENVNKVTASLDFTGAAPAFRRAVSQTDFEEAGPAYEFGDFQVHVLDWLEGQMVYVDQSRRMAVVGQYLWMIMTCKLDVLEMFIEDLARGASGVKVIDYNAGPYRDAGAAWQRMHGAMTPAQEPIAALRSHLQDLLSKVEAIGSSPERSGEQYQVMFSQIASATEQFEALQEQMASVEALLDLTREAIANL